jgi:hypothetical protein
MEQFLTGLLGIFTKVENIALLISMSVNVGLGWAHVIWRREERQDRAAMLETFNELTNALNSVKVILSAHTGKPIL